MRQFDKCHASTVAAAAPLLAHRFVSYEGKHASAAPAAAEQESQSLSETAAAPGETVSVVTGYSFLAEAAEAIAFGAYVKPAADSSGKAAKDSASDHCDRALGAAAQAGDLIEVQLLHHVH